MPTYVYRREDGTTFEIQQRITEDPLETCPDTGQPVERLISGGSGLIFKGDGFYVNDYASDRSNGTSSAASSNNGENDASSESSDAGTKATSDTDAASNE